MTELMAKEQQRLCGPQSLRALLYGPLEEKLSDAVISFLSHILPCLLF